MSLLRILKSIINGAMQVISYILGAVSRIFAPRDDNYPATGVQPFEGDIANNKDRY
ncbi:MULTISPECIES: hypothetical protein [unclassified Nostoc]|uniref:hypothetical protein n=1 Tax=Nostoc sp. C052 TaxID=2576902 RepID=UPI0015C3EF5D|nr:hypothetical protein [Nostoc sp. C052]